MQEANKRSSETKYQVGPQEELKEALKQGDRIVFVPTTGRQPVEAIVEQNNPSARKVSVRSLVDSRLFYSIPYKAFLVLPFAKGNVVEVQFAGKSYPARIEGVQYSWDKIQQQISWELRYTVQTPDGHRFDAPVDQISLNK